MLFLEKIILYFFIRRLKFLYILYLSYNDNYKKYEKFIYIFDEIDRETYLEETLDYIDKRNMKIIYLKYRFISSKYFQILIFIIFLFLENRIKL